MQVKCFIRTELFATLGLLLSAVAQPHAQTTNTNPVLPADSIIMIKQLLTAKLMQLGQAKFSDQMNAANIERLVKDSVALDSLGKMVLLKMRGLKTSVSKQGQAIISDGINTSKDMVQQSITELFQTSHIKSLITTFAGLTKQPLLEWKAGAVQIYGHRGSSIVGTANEFMNSSSITGEWSVLNIPLTMHMVRQEVSGLQNYSRNMFSLQFDKEAYLRSLRQQLNLKIRQQDLFSYDQVVKKIKDRALAGLKSTLDSIDTAYKEQLGSVIKGLDNPAGLLKGDGSMLRTKLQELFPLVNQIDHAATQTSQEISISSPNLQMGDSLLKVLAYKENIDKIITVLDSFKALLQPGNIVNQLQDSAVFHQEEIKQMLSDPGKLKAMVKDQLDLDGLQKLFLNISEFKMGLHTICLSPLSVNQYANNGISASFYNKNKFLFVMLGKQATLNGIFSNPRDLAVMPMSKSAMGISLGKGDITGDHTHVGLFSYQYGRSGAVNEFAVTVPGKTIVTTISNRFTVGEKGRLMIELSRSSHSYTNQSLYDTMQTSAGTGKQLASAGNMFDQMALTLQLNGTSDLVKMDYDIHFAKTGQAYTNPGNLFLTAGATELGSAFRKDLFQRKLQVSAKFNYHDYQFSSIGTKWINYNFSLQAKWKLKKGQSFAVRYQPYFSQHIQNGSRYAIANSRLALDGNFRKRFGNINYQHAITLSVSQSKNVTDSISVTNGIDFNSMQTFAIGKRSWYLNVQYTRANSIPLLLFFSTQFNVEAGCMYNLCKGVSGTTAIHYNSMQQWYRQTGIKQSLSAQISDQIIVSFYADLQKRLKRYAPFYTGSTSLNWSLQYLLK